MTSARIVIDISEFAEVPLSTGIQRVVRMLIKHWPADVHADFVKIDYERGVFVTLPHPVLEMLLNAPSHLPVDELRQYSTRILVNCTHTLEPIEASAVLIPEVFYDLRRIMFYKTRRDDILSRVCILVYDFKPFTNPGVYRIGPSGALGLMPYLMFVRSVAHRSFISQHTKDVYCERVSREINHFEEPVFPLGCNGFKARKQAFSNSRKDLLCIGTFEGKKGQEIVFDAFQQVAPHLKSGYRLVFIGRVPESPPSWLMPILNSVAEDVVVVRAPSDETLGEAFDGAAATLFISTNEGYGLPALESLHLGVPVLVHASLPCLANLQSGGQLRLSDVNVSTVREALEGLLAPDRLQAFWAEAAMIRLPSWEDFAGNTANWVVASRANLPSDGGSQFEDD